MAEDAEAHAIIGGNKQGKSSLVKLLVEKYDKRSQKVVILNNSNPLAFSNYAYYSTPDILHKRWHGIIRYHNEAGGFKQSLADVYEAARSKRLTNGCVVFDDCTKYIDSNVPQDVKDFLVDRRMINLDLFFTTHSLAFLPPFVRRMVNTVTVFKTAENFEKPREVKELKYANYEALFDAWTEVMAAAPNKGFIQPHLTIETGI